MPGHRGANILRFRHEPGAPCSKDSNIAFHHTNVEDFQAQVQTAEVGVNGGYLVNADEVRVLGVEPDASTCIDRNLSLYGALAYTDGEYIPFTNALVSLEETGAASALKDISGGALPRISKWACTISTELLSNR